MILASNSTARSLSRIWPLSSRMTLARKARIVLKSLEEDKSRLLRKAPTLYGYAVSHLK